MKNRRAGLGFLPQRHAIPDCDPFPASGHSGMSAEFFRCKDRGGGVEERKDWR